MLFTKTPLGGNIRERFEIHGSVDVRVRCALNRGIHGEVVMVPMTGGDNGIRSESIFILEILCKQNYKKGTQQRWGIAHLKTCMLLTPVKATKNHHNGGNN
jgi:hypothetical protein